MITAKKIEATASSIPNIDAANHVSGKSVYVDDIPVMEGTLIAKIFDSTHAHARITLLDYSKAEAMEGVAKIFVAKDIPGRNEIGGIIHDEPLLADGIVTF